MKIKISILILLINTIYISFAQGTGRDQNIISLQRKFEELYTKGFTGQMEIIDYWKNNNPVNRSIQLFYTGLGFYGLYYSESNSKFKCQYAKKAMEYFYTLIDHNQEYNHGDLSENREIVENWLIRSKLYLDQLAKIDKCYIESISKSQLKILIRNQIKETCENKLFNKELGHFTVLQNSVNNTAEILSSLGIGKAEIELLDYLQGTSNDLYGLKGQLGKKLTKISKKLTEMIQETQDQEKMSQTQDLENPLVHAIKIKYGEPFTKLKEKINLIKNNQMKVSDDVIKEKIDGASSVIKFLESLIIENKPLINFIDKQKNVHEILNKGNSIVKDDIKSIHEYILSDSRIRNKLNEDNIEL